MDQDRILYRGEAFTLTGNSLRQDAAHWAEVQPDGQVKTMKNGRYSEWRIFPEAGNAPHYRGNFEVLNQAYGLALHEAGALLNEEGTFRTGANGLLCGPGIFPIPPIWDWGCGMSVPV